LAKETDKQQLWNEESAIKVVEDFTLPFAEIVGQDRAIQVLKRSLATGKVAHAYVFEGIAGCGKKMTALAFIQSIFCGTGAGCGHCPSCRKLAAQQHPDLHLLAPDGAFLKIDQIRELQRELALRPFEARQKAAIIDDADRLNPAAANALLKTLEEPPGNAILILLTSNIEGLLPTVLSRCQRLRFAPLPLASIEALLLKRGTTSEAARIAAALSGGSLQKALEIQDEEVLQSRKTFIEQMTALSLGEITPLLRGAEELAKDKEQALAMLDLLKTFFRDLLLLHGGSTEFINCDLAPLLQREAGRFSLDGIMQRIQFISQAQHALLRNVNTRLALEVLFMRLAAR
jgi:DNA polymerase-3 subunit delta'